MLTSKKCSFCGKDIHLGEGTTLVKKDGSIQQFCSSKCRKNTIKLKRDPRKQKWTAYYQKGKE